MKTQPLHEIDVFLRKEITFSYGGGKEILLRELSAVDFFTAIKILFNRGIRDFFSFLNVPPVQTGKIFKRFLKTFLTLHKLSLNEDGRQQAGGIAIEEAIKEGIKVIKIFALTYHVDPAGAGKNYSLRQMLLWLRDDENQCREKTQGAGEARGEGKIPYLPVTSNARNFKEWTDGAGNKCRRWEVEI